MSMDSAFETRPRRILVVDDNEDAASMLAALLRAHHHLVRRAYDGPSAVEAAQDFQPEFVFLDLMMPEMDGFAVAQQLREQEQMHTTRMVIVALTAHSSPAFREATAEAGFDSHLCKPAKAETVLGLLQTSSRASAAEVELQP